MFIFSTGIENSIPTIDNGRHRVDQFALCDHYRHWQRDFELVSEMGIRHLRYGTPLHTTWLGEGKYDWSFADETFADLKAKGITPILDLCHFGLPDWVGNFQNPDFPALFARYARDLALRYPWIIQFTPVNEMFVCATFSARYGWWNEQATDSRSYARALKHVAEANVLAMEEILKVQPAATFIQSESIEYAHAHSPAGQEAADLLNAQRFIATDLNYGHELDPLAKTFMLENGITQEELDWFKQDRLDGLPRCVLGLDYYLTCERYIESHHHSWAAGDVCGFVDLATEYYERYRLPLMHTETNMAQDDLAVDWLRKQWAAAQVLRKRGIPLIGFTWYSLTDQIDWDTGLRECNERLHPVGLYDLNRELRPVGREYQNIIAQNS